MTIYWNQEILPFCCGILEVGDFTEPDDCDSEANSPKAAFRSMVQEAKGRPIMFNFVKKCKWDGGFYDEYEAEELREFVMAHPKAMNITTFINPNSKNMVDCWIIKDYLENAN